MEQQTPDNFLSYLAGTQEAEYHNLYTFAVDSMTFSTKIKIFHWSTESGFNHTHFEEIYNIISDFADELVEIVLGTGTEFKITSKTYMFSDEIYNKENAMRKLRSYIDEVIKLETQYKSKVALNNLFADTIQKLEKEYGLLLKFN